MKPKPGQEGVHLPIAATDCLMPNRREATTNWGGAAQPAPTMQGGTQMVQDYGAVDANVWRSRTSPASATRATAGLIEKPAEKVNPEMWPAIQTGMKRS